MWTEQRLRDELHAMFDRFEPPVSEAAMTTVLRRGRRRLLLRRAAGLGGVAAAVTAIGVGAALIPAPAGGSGPVAPAATPTTAPSTATNGSLPPGWLPVKVAPPITETPGQILSTLPSGANRQPKCRPAKYTELPAATTGIKPEAEVVPAFEAAVTKVAAPAQVKRVRPTDWTADDPKTGGPRGFVEVDVTDARGVGSVGLEVIPLTGTPRQVADAEAYQYANCESPVRTELPDGTILQLYPMMTFNPRQPTQVVQVYTPRGHRYIATAYGFGSVNYKPVAGGETVEGGRGSVPLSTEQLVRLAHELAALG